MEETTKFIRVVCIYKRLLEKYPGWYFCTHPLTHNQNRKIVCFLIASVFVSEYNVNVTSSGNMLWKRILVQKFAETGDCEGDVDAVEYMKQNFGLSEAEYVLIWVS